MRTARITATSRAGLLFGALAVAVAALAGCAATDSTGNAVADNPVPVSAPQSGTTARTYATPNKLEIARERLNALTNEQQAAVVDRSRSDSLIATLKASASCAKETKSCDKKLAMLAEERDRLDKRLKQLPIAIDTQQARVSQLAAAVG